jgi:ornithine carbamoyltransferase
MMVEHILRLRDLSAADLETVIRRGLELKSNPDLSWRPLEGRGLLLLFEKTSTRTTVSYQAAMGQLGGYSIVLSWKDSNFSISPISHETRYVSRNCDVIMARLLTHSALREVAANSSVPVINGCDDRYHPSQALADFMTILEVAGKLAGVTLCYVGVRNNVANSLIEGSMALGVRLLLVTPLSNPAAADEELDRMAAASGLVEYRDDLAVAASEADFIYTDTWVDMENFGDPSYATEKDRRVKIMSPYQLNRENLGDADPWVMHDMPIHPGFEISEDLVESPRSVIYQQAENRMHAQKALLLHLLGITR